MALHGTLSYDIRDRSSIMGKWSYKIIGVGGGGGGKSSFTPMKRLDGKSFSHAEGGAQKVSTLQRGALKVADLRCSTPHPPMPLRIIYDRSLTQYLYDTIYTT